MARCQLLESWKEGRIQVRALQWGLLVVVLVVVVPTTPSASASVILLAIASLGIVVSPTAAAATLQRVAAPATSSVEWVGSRRGRGCGSAFWRWWRRRFENVIGHGRSC